MINPVANNWMLPLRDEEWTVGPGAEQPPEVYLFVLAKTYGDSPIYDSMKMWLFRRFYRMTCVQLRDMHRTLGIEALRANNKRKLVNNLTSYFMERE